MDAKLIGNIVTAVISLLPKETGKELIDKVFDMAEDAVRDSSNKIDDAVLIPIFSKLREILDVPDDDDE